MKFFSLTTSAANWETQIAAFLPINSQCLPQIWLLQINFCTASLRWKGTFYKQHKGPQKLSNKTHLISRISIVRTEELHPEGLQSTGLLCLVPCNEASSVVYKTNTVDIWHIWCTSDPVVELSGVGSATNRANPSSCDSMCMSVLDRKNDQVH